MQLLFTFKVTTSSNLSTHGYKPVNYQEAILDSVMLTVRVHVVTRHLRWGEALLEGVSVVAVVFHGQQLLLGWRKRP